jgi:excisionase family DNA binding protein
MKDSYLTPQEVARRLHLNEQTVRRYLREGQLGGYRLGNRWLITDADVLRFLETQDKSQVGDLPHLGHA